MILVLILNMTLTFLQDNTNAQDIVLQIDSLPEINIHLCSPGPPGPGPPGPPGPREPGAGQDTITPPDTQPPVSPISVTVSLPFVLGPDGKPIPASPGGSPQGSPGADDQPLNTVPRIKNRKELIAELDWWSKYHVSLEDMEDEEEDTDKSKLIVLYHPY